MWGLYLTAKEYGTRPSDLLCIEDRYAAYCLDNACREFGQALEAELSNVEGKNKKEIAVKSERVMSKWLELPMRYRDPVKAGKVALPVRKEV